LDWLSGWQYRQTHTLTAGVGAGANYQMSFTVHYGAGVSLDDDVYCDSKCQADFDDVRFTASDGTTVLPCWLQSKVDGDYAVFWVKVTDDLDSDVDVAVYYGNAGAVSVSNQANTFVDVISGVVGAWNMEEALATDPVVDYSGNGNTGTATGTTIVASPFFTGKTARQYDGTDDFVNLGNVPAYNLSATAIDTGVTFILFVQADAITGDDNARIFDRYSGAGFRILMRNSAAGGLATFSWLATTDTATNTTSSPAT